MTKIVALGALGALGAGAYAIARAAKQRTAARTRQDVDTAFDYGDLDQAVVVTEEVVIVTEAGPYEIDMELIPANEPGEAQPGPKAQGQAQTPVEASSSSQGSPSSPNSEDPPFEMPGRDAGPR